MKEYKRYSVQVRTSKKKHSNFRTDHRVTPDLHSAKEMAAYLKHHYPSHDVRIVVETYTLTKTEVLK